MIVVNSRLSFLRKYYRGELFDRWLLECKQAGAADGSYLVQLLGKPTDDGRPGLADNVYAAEQFLKAAEAEGLITRCCWRPSLEAQFFGVGGTSIKYAKDNHTLYRWFYADNILLEGTDTQR